MLNQIVNRLQGQVRIRVETPFPERVLNLCGARNLAFWDMEWESETAFTCRLNRRDYYALRRAVKQLDCRLTVVRTEGVPFFLGRFRRRRRGTAVLLSGPEDLITDGARVWCVTGGSGRMSLVTGTGCMLSVLCGVFAPVEPDAAAAAALASAFWKICARRAEHLAADRGSGSFRTALLDAANTLTASDAAREAEILTL